MRASRFILLLLLLSSAAAQAQVPPPAAPPAPPPAPAPAPAPAQTAQTPYTYTYTPMAAPWADVTPALGAMGIVNWLREDPGPLSAFQVKMGRDFIRMYGEAYGLPTDSTTLALQSAAASAFPPTDPAQIEHARHASILHGIVTLFEARSGTKVAGGETPSQAQPASPFDWGTVQPGATNVRSIAIGNGCSSVKVVAISHAVPHLSAPASVSVAPGGSSVDFSLDVPAGAQGIISGTITLTYAGDDTCKPRTASFPVTARIGG